ncbi:MAG: MBL fold metallo-hydrolase [Candidatus Lokiarchaeota archaeon]|nr:MBL fold metallo-hydrolase [Candidatus Lokiarchaeota archaeon]
MKLFEKKQYVCKVCGFNIIGYFPERCPFCGASNENFITAEYCSDNYKVLETKVTDKVIRLNSIPSLGYEHTAYSIKSENQTIWIDCPSTFDSSLERMDKIIFTHHHFLGASNLYRSFNNASVWIHNEDSKHPISKKHTFDKKFDIDFKLSGINAFHINGHTPGFTFYTFEEIIFVCDYVSMSGSKMKFNPYGPPGKTIEGGKMIKKILENRDYQIVCGFDYVVDYSVWMSLLVNLLNS